MVKRSKWLVRIKRELLHKRERLLGDIDRELSQFRLEYRSSPVGTADASTLSRDENLMFQLIEIESAGLDEIDDALARIDRGGYGMCERCGKEIDPRRLRALASATLCLECKYREERRLRPGGAQKETWNNVEDDEDEGRRPDDVRARATYAGSCTDLGEEPS